MAPNHGEETLGSILGPMGSHWDETMSPNGKKYHANNSNFLLLRAFIDLGKNRIDGYGAKSRWGPP